MVGTGYSTKDLPGWNRNNPMDFIRVEDDVIRDIVKKVKVENRRKAAEQLQAIISRYLVLEYIYT